MPVILKAEKWRAFACLSDFRPLLKESCQKYGVLVRDLPQNNTCQDCGQMINFEEQLYGQCPAGHRQEKNKNAARDLWEAADVEGKRTPRHYR